MVRHQDHRRARPFRGQAAQPDQQPLASAQVQAGEGLVEEQELRVAHECPGQQDLLTLPFGDDPEGRSPISATPPLDRSRSALSQSSSL